MNNLKISTKITLQITCVITVCIALLYVIANRSMTSMMKKSELDNMSASLNAQTSIIKQYIDSQETLLSVFGEAPEIRSLLKDPNNPAFVEAAQAYTVNYYSQLDRWEGLYVGEWDTHVIAHSNPTVVGMTTRKGESLKALQNAMLKNNSLYNAGIIVSPATGKLTLSMYCPVFDEDGKTVLGYVGGGPFAEGLKELLDASHAQKSSTMQYSMINVENGTYIFDKDDSKIAGSVEDPMLLSVIEILKSRPTELTGGKDYIDAKQGKSIARYEYIAEHGFVVVAYDSEAGIYANVRKNMLTLVVICLISIILISVLSWIFIHLSTRPLKYVENSIMQLKNLNLQKDDKLTPYLHRKSEIGQIATALDSLYVTFHDIVLTLNQCSGSLNDSAVKMTSSSEVLLECVSKNSEATTHFASHTEDITQAVQHVDEEIQNITRVVAEVEERIHQGTHQSDNLLEKVSKLQSSASQSMKQINLQIEQNQSSINESLENLQSLMRIDEMASQILEITSQTNLLSLNASIEAARAGEAGKGFAVVANEIGNLAGSSAQTASAIQTICNETKENIGKVEKCFDDIIEFLQKDVATQFTAFADATTDYYQSITEIQTIIQAIDRSSNAFTEAVSAIKTRIDEVQNVPSEKTINGDEILKRAEQTAQSTHELVEIVSRNKKNALAIQEIVGKFSGE